MIVTDAGTGRLVAILDQPESLGLCSLLCGERGYSRAKNNLKP